MVIEIPSLIIFKSTNIMKYKDIILLRFFSSLSKRRHGNPNHTDVAPLFPTVISLKKMLKDHKRHRKNYYTRDISITVCFLRPKNKLYFFSTKRSNRIKNTTHGVASCNNPSNYMPRNLWIPKNYRATRISPKSH